MKLRHSALLTNDIATSLLGRNETSRYQVRSGTGRTRPLETIMKTLLALTALAGGLCFAPALSAQTVTRTVSSENIDTGTAAGRAKLDRRIEIAVKTACGDASSADARGRKALNRCRADALARALPQRDQLIAQRNGERLAAK
jgi:UrcA family protein